MIKIIEKSFGTKYRAAVISDTHGSYSLLRRLLERDEVKSADHTVFNEMERSFCQMDIIHSLGRCSTILLDLTFSKIRI